MPGVPHHLQPPGAGPHQVAGPRVRGARQDHHQAGGQVRQSQGDMWIWSLELETKVDEDFAKFYNHG